MKKIEALVKFTQKHSNIAYDADLKKEFKRLGTAALKEIRDAFGPLHSSEISFNPAGIAMSGDFHLKVMFNAHQGVDMFFNLGFGNHVTYRGIKGLKDYTGKENRQMCFENFLNLNDLRSRFLLAANSVQLEVA